MAFCHRRIVISTFRLLKEANLKIGPAKRSSQFVGNDRDNQHYKVQFTDPLGRKHETRCKANTWTSNLFWQRTPAEFLSDLPVENEGWSRLRADPGSSKEQIIDDLVAENKRLREQLILSSHF